MAHPFPTYSAPPLTEVSIGLQFQRLERLKIPHFGLFWERIRAEYPMVEHAQPIFTNEREIEEGFPLPRIWFIDKSDSKLLQLQPNRINFNWRHRDGAAPYPHFESISKEFERLLNLFQQFLLEADIGIITPLVSELTYINVFEKGREWNRVEDLYSLINDFNWTSDKSRFLPQPAHINWSTSFLLPDSMGNLNVRLNPAMRVGEDTPLIQMELTAICQHSGISVSDLPRYYEIGHEWIVKGFADLTNIEAQKKFWGRAP